VSQLVSYSYNAAGVGGNIELGIGEFSRQVSFPFPFQRPPVVQANVIRPTDESDRISLTLRGVTGTGFSVDFYSGIPETGEGQKYILSWSASETF
jgi:hypothetical protein